jgi:hypothetical protein
MRFKLTPGERKRKRIEDAEQVRRWKEEHVLPPASLSALANPNVVPADPVAVKALAEYDRAVRALDQESGFLDPAPDLPACEKHPAEWKPTRPFLGAPLPRAPMCPYCLKEAERKPTSQDVFIDGGYPQKRPTPTQDRLWKEHLVKLEAAGVLLPGSDAEAAAVRRSDELRADDRMRDRGDRQIAYYRPYDETVIYRQPRRRRRGGGHADAHGVIWVHL